MRICIIWLSLAATGALVAQMSLENLRACLDRSDTACASAALAELEKRRSKTDHSPEYLELAAHTLLLQGKYPEALSKIEQALTQRPDEYRYLVIQGRIQQKLGAQPSAIRSFLLAQKLQPKSPEVYFLIGMSFFLEEEYDRARRHLQHVLQLDTSNDKATFMLGVIHAYRNELSEAGSWFAKAVALQPSNAHYRLHYGVLLDRANKKDEAFMQIQRAVELDDNSGLAHHHLGRLYSDRGQIESAREHFVRAVSLQPSLAQAHYRLGVIYRKLGRNSEAARALETFRTLKAQAEHESIAGPDSLLLER